MQRQRAPWGSSANPVIRCVLIKMSPAMASIGDLQGPHKSKIKFQEGQGGSPKALL